MSRDALHKEIDELEVQLRGISPRLSVHAKIKLQIQELKDKLKNETKF